MTGLVIVLYLTVYDSGTGHMLYQAHRQMAEFSLRGDRIEDCRKEGVRQGKALTARYRQTNPSASTNVYCRWERGIARQPA